MTITKDALGDRMKLYEVIETQRRFNPAKPIYARIDGRGFSKFTAHMHRPYDTMMSEAMVATTKFLVAETHASMGYTQSDEISLTWAPISYENGEIFFDGKVQKMVSVIAGMTSSFFTRHCMNSYYLAGHAQARLPHFDCRIFQLPDETEGANAFVWRALDARKNAISMAAHAFFPHKALQGKSGREKLAMMEEKGVFFDAYPDFFKHGTFVRRITEERELNAAELARIPEKHRPAPGQLVVRSAVRDLELGDILNVTNREDVIYHHADPIFRE